MSKIGNNALGFSAARAERPRGGYQRTRLGLVWAAMKSASEEGVSPRSAHAWASSVAISSLTSRDQPSAVLKATIRTGAECRFRSASSSACNGTVLVGSGLVGILRAAPVSGDRDRHFHFRLWQNFTVSVGFNVSTAYRDGGPPTKVSAIVCPLAPSLVARVAVPMKSNFEGCAELFTTDQLNLRAPLEAPPHQVRTVVILVGAGSQSERPGTACETNPRRKRSALSELGLLN